MYWGKVIGTLAGLATLKPALALVGLALGHQFDRGFRARYESATDQLGSPGRLPPGYVQILFECMGHLAKADGRVTEAEIRAARAVMHRLGLKPALVRSAIGWFEDGKAKSFPLRARVTELKRKFARREDLRLLFLRLLVEVSVAKQRVTPRERALVWEICESLDIGRVELAQVEAMLRAQRGFSDSRQGTAEDERLRAAYRALGVSADASNDDVKKAYRRLMSQFHPDKVGARTQDMEELTAAEDRTREIRAAFEMLKARRSIR